MRKDGSCADACFKTEYDPTNSSVCGNIDNCRDPTDPAKNKNCSCKQGMIVDRLG